MAKFNKRHWPIKVDDRSATACLGARETGELCLCEQAKVIQVGENIECPHCKSWAPYKPWVLPWDFDFKKASS